MPSPRASLAAETGGKPLDRGPRPARLGVVRALHPETGGRSEHQPPISASGRLHVDSEARRRLQTRKHGRPRRRCPRTASAPRRSALRPNRRLVMDSTDHAPPPFPRSRLPFTRRWLMAAALLVNGAVPVAAETPDPPFLRTDDVAARRSGRARARPFANVPRHPRAARGVRSDRVPAPGLALRQHRRGDAAPVVGRRLPLRTRDPGSQSVQRRRRRDAGPRAAARARTRGRTMGGGRTSHGLAVSRDRLFVVRRADALLRHAQCGGRRPAGAGRTARHPPHAATRDGASSGPSRTARS